MILILYEYFLLYYSTMSLPLKIHQALFTVCLSSVDPSFMGSYRQKSLRLVATNSLKRCSPTWSSQFFVILFCSCRSLPRCQMKIQQELS